MKLGLKVLDKLAEEEDDVLAEYLYKIYWILPQASILIPSRKRSAITLSIGLLLFYGIICIGHIVILIYSDALLINEKNWELLSLSIHYTLLLFFGTFFVFLYNLRRQHVYMEHRDFTIDVGVYVSGSLYSEQYCVDMFRESRAETFRLMTIPIFIGFVGTVVLGVPYATKWLTGMENPYTPSGINMNLPIALWYPFPTHEGALHLVALFGQCLAVGSVAIIIFSGLFLFIDVTQRLRCELRVIGYSLRTLLARSLKMHQLNRPEKMELELFSMDSNYQRCIGRCLRDTVVHHQTVTRMISTYNVVHSLPCALAYSTGMLVIAISLYSILQALTAGNYWSIFTFILMIMAETLTMFLLSLLGALLTTESESLRDELYFMDWFYLDFHNRKTLLNLQTAITEPVVLKAAGLIDLNMDTFSSIMNSAYSFFNIMNAQ